MSVSPEPCEATPETTAARRLEFDLDDLRFENARLKTSIAERQAEIELLSNRLGVLQARLEGADRGGALRAGLRWIGAMRRLLSRRGSREIVRVLTRR